MCVYTKVQSLLVIYHGIFTLLMLVMIWLFLLFANYQTHMKIVIFLRHHLTHPG